MSDDDKDEGPAGIWINAFSVIRPTDETLREIGLAVVRACRIPGTTDVRVSIT